MGRTIFDYLESNYKDLFSLANDINEKLFISPYESVAKSRVYIEKLTEKIAILEKMDELNSLSLFERLKQLKREEVITQEIGEYFQLVRTSGNQAVHDIVEGELITALQFHKIIYKITAWFIETYIDYNFTSPIYKTPTPPSYIEKGKDTVPIKVNKDVESIQNRKSECLIEELAKLKESSKEAVEGLNEFTEFKQYMHVDRNAQRELEDIILEASKQSNAQLVLVCGSVGDGKSHIISYFKNKYPDIIRNFILHNDATESLEPNKTSMDTLNDLLEDFTDEKIRLSNKKLILAINLGTLNNFIDSNYGDRFTILKKFVADKKILERSITDNRFDMKSNIQFVNFSDFNLYTLKDERIESEYIKTLIKRVTDKSEINIFYKSYNNNCMNCNNKDICPIKLNYELISEEKVQDAIVNLLVQCIIKNKIIISTRALLNFMYDILIPRTYIDIHSPTFKSHIGKLKNEDYINSLTPNIIFDHSELSFIFKALNILDPLNVRNKEVDDFIIKFHNSTNVVEFFDKYVDYPKGYINKLSNVNNEEKLDKKIKKELLKLFIRSYYLCGRGNIFDLQDKVYEDFIRYVYYWNKGERSKLKELYNEIKEGIIKWNGEADKNHINIFIGKNQVNYKVSEELELKPDTTNLPSNNENRLEKFLTTIEIKYKSDRLSDSCSIDVDFPLYELLIRVGNGYRPNKKDKNHFIKFIEFMNKIEMAGSQKTQLTFSEKNREVNKKFRLEYDDEFEIYKFMEI
ncbi:MAG: DNA phosphorothioation-dependent restriction protein DptF [Turicibacter sp.]|nr:DNA phosphorothioation-dependent restriction protein DptF [Turicibacter sp.]